MDGGSEETQYSVLSTCYSVHSVFSSWYSVLNTQEHCLAAVQCVVACRCCCCVFDHCFGGSFHQCHWQFLGPAPRFASREPRERSGDQEHYETSEPAPRSAPRTDAPSPTSGRPQGYPGYTTQAPLVDVAGCPPARDWTNFAPSATVGIPPTAASWTNSPPPHSSIHWDDHITGMITSTSWDDHITGMIDAVPEAQRRPAVRPGLEAEPAQGPGRTMRFDLLQEELVHHAAPGDTVPRHLDRREAISYCPAQM